MIWSKRSRLTIQSFGVRCLRWQSAKISVYLFSPGGYMTENFYKCIDVRTCIAHEKGDAAACSAEADRICADIRAELTESSKNNTSKTPRILIDQQSRSPYKILLKPKVR